MTKRGNDPAGFGEVAGGVDFGVEAGLGAAEVGFIVEGMGFGVVELGLGVVELGFGVVERGLGVVARGLGVVGAGPRVELTDIGVGGMGFGVLKGTGFGLTEGTGLIVTGDMGFGVEEDTGCIVRGNGEEVGPAVETAGFSVIFSEELSGATVIGSIGISETL